MTTPLYSALNDLKTETLVKIAEGFKVPGNWYRQKTWNKCIFNQISGGHSGFASCANAVGEELNSVRRVIMEWDNLTTNQLTANTVLRQYVIDLLKLRGVLVEFPRVKSVTSVVKFESTMVPSMDELPLVSNEEIDSFLQDILSEVNV